MKEGKYSIKDIENLTGIKRHTIRIWEKRYALLEPKRTDTNIRYYNDADIKKILNINLLYSNGLKISKIAELEDKELQDKVEEIISEADERSIEKDQALESVIDKIIELNGEEIEKLLEIEFLRSDANAFFYDFIFPLLERIGKLWQLNTISVAHEHYFSNILKSFILNKTQNLNTSRINSKKAIFFLHEHEEHEFGLLVNQFFMKLEGWQCYYLGQNVPIEDLKISAKQIDPDIYITSFLTHIGDKKLAKILDQILEFIPKDKLFITGHYAFTSDLFSNLNLKIFKNINEII